MEMQVVTTCIVISVVYMKTTVFTVLGFWIADLSFSCTLLIAFVNTKSIVFKSLQRARKN